MEGTYNKHQYYAKTGSNFKIKENQQNIEYIALKKVPDISTHTLTLWQVGYDICECQDIDSCW